MEEKLIHKELLRLVRSALWHNEELPVSYDEELLSPVFRASRQQAVSALVAQALLSNNVRTNDEGAMEIMSILMGHKRQAATRDAHVAMIAQILSEAQIPYLVFKGQIAARYYHQVSLRSTGDIDFYVPLSHYESAKRLMADKLNVPVVDDQLDKHAEFSYQKTRFELHHRIETFGFAGHQHRFDRWIADEAASPHTLPINGVDVHTLSAVMDILVVFKHLFNHLLVEGVGLRQICDLALMLDRNKGNYDVDLLAARLRQMGYYRGFRAVGALMVDSIGLPLDSFPFPLTKADSRWGRQIMREVMAGGTFGKYGRENKTASLRKSIETAWMAMRHCLGFLPLAPVDIMFLIPRRIGISFKKYL